MLTSLIFTIAIDVITAYAIGKLMNKILCGDDLVLMSDNIDNLREK